LFQKVFAGNTRGILDIFDERVANNDGAIFGDSAKSSKHILYET
jgi:hypothetical protein